MMNQRQPYYFQRPRMAGESLAQIAVPDLRKGSGKSVEEKTNAIKGTFKSGADIIQALTGDRGTHTDRINRMDSGRGVSRSAAQRMGEDR